MTQPSAHTLITIPKMLAVYVALLLLLGRTIPFPAGADGFPQHHFPRMSASAFVPDFLRLQPQGLGIQCGKRGVHHLNHGGHR